MATPDEVDVWIGLDVGKDEHFADVLDDRGEALFARSLGNDEADLDALPTCRRAIHSRTQLSALFLSGLLQEQVAGARASRW